MDILKINASDPDPLLVRKAATILQRGGVIGYPTETVYGLGCNAYDQAAVERIYELKGRPRNRALILIAADSMQVRELTESIPDAAEKLIDAFWPGPVTIIFKSSQWLKAKCPTAADTVAVRIPNSPLCLELIKQCGFPMVSTSANLSGRPPATTAEQVAEIFGDRLDLIIDGGPSPESVPSTVIDAVHEPPKVVRQGAVSALEIRSILDLV